MNPLILQKRPLRFAPLRSPVRRVPEIKLREALLCATSNCDRYGHVISTERP